MDPAPAAAGTRRGCRLGGQRLPIPGCWVWALGWDAGCRATVHAEAVCFCPGLRTGHTKLSEGGWPLSQPRAQGSVLGPSPCWELVGQWRAAGSGSGRPGGWPPPNLGRGGLCLSATHPRPGGFLPVGLMSCLGGRLVGACARLPRGVTGPSDATGCSGSRLGSGGTRGQSWVAAGTALWGWLGGLGRGSGGRPRTRGQATGLLGASVPRAHRWAWPATVEAEKKTSFPFVTENVTALTTGPAQAGGIQAFKSDRFAQNQPRLKVTLKTGGRVEAVLPGKGGPHRGPQDDCLRWRVWGGVVLTRWLWALGGWAPVPGRF